MAAQVLDRVNRLNFDTARDCALGAAAFAALPHEVAGPLTALVVGGAGLYYYRGGSGGGSPSSSE